MDVIEVLFQIGSYGLAVAVGAGIKEFHDWRSDRRAIRRRKVEERDKQIQKTIDVLSAFIGYLARLQVSDVIHFEDKKEYIDFIAVDGQGDLSPEVAVAVQDIVDSVWFRPDGVSTYRGVKAFQESVQFHQQVAREIKAATEVLVAERDRWKDKQSFK